MLELTPNQDLSKILWGGKFINSTFCSMDWKFQFLLSSNLNSLTQSHGFGQGSRRLIPPDMYPLTLLARLLGTLGVTLPSGKERGTPLWAQLAEQGQDWRFGSSPHHSDSQLFLMGLSLWFLGAKKAGLFIRLSLLVPVPHRLSSPQWAASQLGSSPAVLEPALPWINSVLKGPWEDQIPRWWVTA